MNKLLLLLFTVASTVFAKNTETNRCPDACENKKPVVRKMRAGRSAFLEKYDTNKNGRIDADERKEMRKMMDRRLEVRFDKNKDGTLDADERAAYEKFIERRNARWAQRKAQSKKRQEEIGRKLREAKQRGKLKAGEAAQGAEVAPTEKQK